MLLFRPLFKLSPSILLSICASFSALLCPSSRRRTPDVVSRGGDETIKLGAKHQNAFAGGEAVDGANTWRVLGVISCIVFALLSISDHLHPSSSPSSFLSLFFFFLCGLKVRKNKVNVLLTVCSVEVLRFPSCHPVLWLQAQGRSSPVTQTWK